MTCGEIFDTPETMARNLDAARAAYNNPDRDRAVAWSEE
jgi:hypothetical protein